MRQTEFDEPEFLARLRRGDEQAFRALIRRFHGSLIGLATSIIGSRAQAEEVVQDAWLAVFSGIGGFEGRSSLVTWLFSIVLNRARTRATREGAWSACRRLMEGSSPGGRAVDVSEFKPDGHWIEAPRLWDEIEPGAHRRRPAVLGPRDGGDRASAGRPARGDHPARHGGREAEETCALLGISTENQRVLLHRARGRIRKTIDAAIGAPRSAAAVHRRAAGGGVAATTAQFLAAWARYCHWLRYLDLHWLIGVMMISQWKDATGSLGRNILLANMRLVEMFYGYSRLGGQQCRSLAHSITQRLGKCRVVEDADAIGIEIPGHPRRVAYHRQCAGDDHTVVT